MSKDPIAFSGITDEKAMQSTVSSMKVARPTLRCYGGKRRIAPWTKEVANNQGMVNVCPGTALAYSALTGVDAMASGVESLPPTTPFLPCLPLTWRGCLLRACRTDRRSVRGCKTNDAKNKAPASMAFADRFHAATTMMNTGYVVHGGEYWRGQPRETKLLPSLP